MHSVEARNPIGELGRRLFGRWVEDVPDDIALCEFDCRKRQCRMGEWEICKRRTDRGAVIARSLTLR